VGADVLDVDLVLAAGVGQEAREEDVAGRGELVEDFAPLR
jgi:hypothetical protein